MPSRSPRLPFPRQVVTAIVVVHDGDRWLPHCLDAIRDQRRRPQRLVVVDTGSVDGSVEIVAAAGDEIELVRLPRDTGFGAAVTAGLAGADASPRPRPPGPGPAPSRPGHRADLAAPRRLPARARRVVRAARGSRAVAVGDGAGLQADGPRR